MQSPRSGASYRAHNVSAEVVQPSADDVVTNSCYEWNSRHAKNRLYCRGHFRDPTPGMRREIAAAAHRSQTRAQIVVPADLSGPENKAVELLVEEIQARTRLRLNVDNAWPGTRRCL